jgi:glycosyltransferase involved in cell wall biosynthesis
MYNEAGAITVTLERIRDTAMPGFVSKVEVIIVDDCSTDNSASLAEKITGKYPEVRVIRLPVNSGKGAAVAAGVKAAAGDTILVQDADMELDPADIPSMLQKMHSGNFSLVSGSRFGTGKSYPGHAAPAAVLNRLISAVAARMTGRRITDLTCGYKLIRKELFENLDLREKRFGFETELMLRALRDKEVSFAEESVSYAPRKKSEGKKIHAGDGLGIAIKLLRYGLAGKNLISFLTVTLLLSFMTLTMLTDKLWKDEQRVIEWDAISYYAYLPAAFIYHDLSLAYADNYSGPHKLLVWPEKGPEGKYVIKTTMGLSLLWTPFFLAGHSTALISGSDAGGYSPPYKFFLLLSALIFLTAGLIYLRRILLEHASDKVTAIVLSAFVAGTNLYWYTLYQGTMSHVYSFALICAFTWYTMKWHKRTIPVPGTDTQGSKPAHGSDPEGRSRNERGWLWPAARLGMLLGLITLIRPTNIIIVILFLLYGVTTLSGFRKRTLELVADYRQLAVMAVMALVVWVPQMIYWKEMTGHWLYFSYGSDERFFFGDPAIIKGLFSWRKGLFIYTPLMIFAIAGIITLWLRRSPHALAVTLFMPINIYIIFSWWCWWYGGGFGQRAFIDSYALMAVASSSLLSAGMISGKKEQKRINPAAMTAGRKILRRLIPATFILLALIGIFYNFQYYHGAIHWDSMTREAYFDSFGRIRPSVKFHELLEAPDYDSAREGLDR